MDKVKLFSDCWSLKDAEVYAWNVIARGSGFRYCERLAIEGGDFRWDCLMTISIQLKYHGPEGMKHQRDHLLTASILCEDRARAYPLGKYPPSAP
ncbi:hypothetical protein D3C71_1255050 [compost metagenome]